MLQGNNVVAVFMDSAVSFDLFHGATFGDLAERLEAIAERHDQATMSVHVTFPKARQLPSLRLVQ